MDSPVLEFFTPVSHAARWDQPSPLRIVKEPDEHKYSDGISVEDAPISAQGTPEPPLDGNIRLKLGKIHNRHRFFEYGCLYDLTVEIVPTAGTSIVQSFEEQAFPTTIYAGSSAFLLAHIRVDCGMTGRSSGPGHIRHQSDELMEDLELQLGSCVAGHMHVRVSYSHSAFPKRAGSEAEATGVSSMRSSLQTTATATLKRRDALSPWSPYPGQSRDQFLQVIERYWGAEKAAMVAEQIGDHQQPSRRSMMARSACAIREQSLTEKQSMMEERSDDHQPPPRRLLKARSTGAIREQSIAEKQSTCRSWASNASIGKDSTAKASTLGRAIGRKAQRLLYPPGQSKLPTPPSEASLDGSINGMKSQARLSAMDSVGLKRSLFELYESVQAKAKGGTGWHWGLWF
ncbi:hypothetical protein RJ55_06635 [Drechmeria coniospora]|nr:hypothetical protein RJ55_06635 [Drechmeria coniospora]